MSVPGLLLVALTSALLNGFWCVCMCVCVRVHDNVHDDMIMYVIMHDLHPVHRYDQHIIAMINSLS